MEPKVIAMPSRLDARVVTEMRQIVEKAFDSGADLIIFNFEACKFMDSLGLSIIVTGLKLSGSKNKKLRLVHVGKEVRLLLQITRFDRICDIHETMDTAREI